MTLKSRCQVHFLQPWQGEERKTIYILNEVVTTTTKKKKVIFDIDYMWGLPLTITIRKT